MAATTPRRRWASSSGSSPRPPCRRPYGERREQLASSALLSLAHGGNDAQKTMGVIVGLLASPPVQAAVRGETGLLHHLYVPNAGVAPPIWVEVIAYTAIS